MASIKVPYPSPSPSKDSDELVKAFQVRGTDREMIIKIMARRNADQRRLICRKYEERCREKLLDNIDYELSQGILGFSSDFWKAVKLWTMDPPQRDASLCREALKKKVMLMNKPEVEIIVEIACASSPDHLIEVRRAYCALYRCSLEEDIGIHVKGSLRKLLVSLVSSYRYNGEEVDEELVKSEAETLHNAIVNNNYSTIEEDEVIRIVSTRSKSQLKATFDHYSKSYRKSICQDLGNGKGIEFARMLHTTVCCISSPVTYFAKVLKTSIKGLGTDEDTLTRTIVTRAEIDMERIKEEYQHLYNTSLEKDVVGDTSAHYKDFLITLLGCGSLVLDS